MSTISPDIHSTCRLLSNRTWIQSPRTRHSSSKTASDQFRQLVAAGSMRFTADAKQNRSQQQSRQQSRLQSSQQNLQQQRRIGLKQLPKLGPPHWNNKQHKMNYDIFNGRRPKAFLHPHWFSPFSPDVSYLMIQKFNYVHILNPILASTCQHFRIP